MGYSSGMISKQVLVARRKEAEKSAFGLDAGGVKWEAVGEFWASVTFQRGMRQMREGALDSYDVVMVRMRWNEHVSRESILKYDGRWYQIESFNEDYRENIIQMTAREMAGMVNLEP
jgi:SPP1 family predicted phage head-tail adaptor